MGHATETEACLVAKSNVLLIPEGLQSFGGPRAIMKSGRAEVLHKLLNRDAFGTEFFSSTPCLGYVLRGRETFFDADGEETTVAQGDTLLVPRHHDMVSEFSKEKGPLEAFLFFFSGAVITDFLAATFRSAAVAPKSKTALFAGSLSLREYVDALPKVHRSMRATPHLVKAKLLELLLLLNLHDRQCELLPFLVHENAQCTRRKIKQIMQANALADLSVADYAMLSGRPVSALLRDIKREVGETPSAWLRRARLEHAHEQVISGQD